MGFKRTLLFLFLCIATGPLAGQSVEYFDDILARGQQAVVAGNPEAALQIWWGAVDTTLPGLTDPRIGRAFIETATRDSLTGYYEQAQQAYQWGLENPSHPSFADELIRQVAWLEPVSDAIEQARWQQQLEQGSYRELGSSIRKYWERVDLTLGTPFNEQILQYWERIAYSKEHFRENDNTIYGTDDRGEIYVQYGSPDQVKRGVLKFWRTTTLNGRWMSSQVESQLRKWHQDPDYEIWIYEQANPEDSSNLVFTFGKGGGAFDYGLRHDVSEFISELAPPGVKSYFMLVYYWQLWTKGTDPYFDGIFQELHQYEVQSVPWPSYRTLYAIKRAELNRIYERAPDISSFDLPAIPLQIRQYRVLDEQNRPRLLSFLYSRPWRAMFLDPATRDFYGSEYYLSAHSVTLDSLNEIVNRTSQSGVSLRQGGMGNISNIPPRVSYLSVPYDSTIRSQKFTVEMHHRNLGSDRSEQLFPENLRALGSLTAEALPPPLATGPDRLEMGDLVLGFRNPQRPETEPFGFLVPAEPAVENGEPLMVHVELYHLQGSPDGPAAFQIEYRVTENRNFVQRLLRQEEEVNLTFNFEAISGTFRENLEIETTPFRPGSYTLWLTARQGEQEVSRSVEFEVVAEE